MAHVAIFNKLLQLKEKDKNIAQKVYQDSVAHFEEVATELYALLKKKEIAEEAYLQQLQSTTNVTELNMNYEYIARLEKQIAELQPSLQQARGEMELKQQELTSAHIEVKKYEKIIDNKLEHEKFLNMENEKKQMDEISMQQFIKQGK